MGGIGVGTQVAGYRIEALAGRGGMGMVFRATQLGLDRQVALKLIAPEFAEDEGFRRRFEQESRVAASIDHPNVIPVHEAGEHEGHLFLAMRYVEGTDLRSMIAHGALSADLAISILDQVAGALDAAHARGLVHRDIKPANVLLAGGARPHAYLADFGLTKRAASQSGVTKTGQWVGTVDYVAPEQIQGGPLDARADIYALGCVAFHMLTGHVPYERDADMAKVWAHVFDAPPSVAFLRPDLPAELAEVVARAMAKDPAARYPSAGDFARAAGAALQERPITEPERSVAAGAAAPVAAPATEVAPTEAGIQSAPTAGQPVEAPRATTLVGPPHRPAPRDAYPGPVGGPPRRRGLVGIALAAAIVAVAAIAVAVVLSTGALSNQKSSAVAAAPTPTRTVVQTVQNTDPASNPPSQTSPSTSTASTPTPSESPAPALPLTGFQGQTYAVEVPSGWHNGQSIANTGRASNAFTDPDDPSTAINIDDFSTSDSAETIANQNRSARSNDSGYHELSFGQATIAGRPAYKWVFDFDGRRKVDYFVDACGNNYAIVGATAVESFDRFSATFDAVANSLRPSCSG